MVNLIPPEIEDDVLRRYRSGEDVASLHRALWPNGNQSVSTTTLRAILDGMRIEAQARDEPEPSDELPEDVGDLLDDLKRAREKIWSAIEVDPQDATPELSGKDVAAACMVNRAICDNVKAALAVSKHRTELQRHRDWLAGGWRSGMRR